MDPHQLDYDGCHGRQVPGELGPSSAPVGSRCSTTPNRTAAQNGPAGKRGRGRRGHGDPGAQVGVGGDAAGEDGAHRLCRFGRDDLGLGDGPGDHLGNPPGPGAHLEDGPGDGVHARKPGALRRAAVAGLAPLRLLSRTRSAPVRSTAPRRRR